MRVDYIIIGQGIAGTLISWELLNQNKSILVIDANHDECATKIAAGIINPISGKRFVLIPGFEKLNSYAINTYQALEQRLSTKIYNSKQIVRIFKNSEELKTWEVRKDRQLSQQYVLSNNPPNLFNPIINDPFGSITINGGLCDTNNLAINFREYLINQKLLLNERIDYSNIKTNQNEIIYKNFSAKTIIFCEGYKISQNPWFKDLPYQHSKGEILEFSVDELPIQNEIFNTGKWILPLNNNKIKAGSTFYWDEINNFPSQEGKKEILNDINNLLKSKITVTNHYAGVRPGVLDLYPILGSHAQHKNLVVFNGLGAKGALLGPYYANHLANHLVNSTNLDKNVNVNRFF